MKRNRSNEAQGKHSSQAQRMRQLRQLIAGDNAT
jgi:hypothetical protein